MNCPLISYVFVGVKPIANVVMNFLTFCITLLRNWIDVDGQESVTL